MHIKVSMEEASRVLSTYCWEKLGWPEAVSVEIEREREQALPVVHPFNPPTGRYFAVIGHTLGVVSAIKMLREWYAMQNESILLEDAKRQVEAWMKEYEAPMPVREQNIPDNYSIWKLVRKDLKILAIRLVRNGSVPQMGLAQAKQYVEDTFTQYEKEEIERTRLYNEKNPTF